MPVAGLGIVSAKKLPLTVIWYHQQYIWMRTTTAVTALLLSVLLVPSCTTEVELEAEWENIPVIYGFLSIQDTAHYLRVQKVFLEPGGNALEIAQITDSIYYQDVLVELTNQRSGQTVVMQRVDGADEGLPKEEGVFANEPNVLYKVAASDFDLQGGDQVEVSVSRGEEREPAVAQTVMLNKIDTSGSVSPGSRITRWDYDRNQNVTWRPGPRAAVFDIRFLINYRESSADDPTNFIEQDLEWQVVSGLQRDPDAPRQRFPVSGQAFYQFLGTNIPAADGKIRILDEIEIFIQGGGREIQELIDLGQANAGITSAQSIPVYTNVDNGLGVFTSVYELHRRGIKLSQSAADSLRNGIFTRQLGFQ